MKLVFQGAEARLYSTLMMDRRCIVKERFRKNYRHPDMDNLLRIQRTKAEARALLRAPQLAVAAPTLYLLDLKNFRLYMEEIEGIVLKELLTTFIHREDYKEYFGAVMTLLGANIARLHEGNLIHGDLTTSNFVIRTSLPPSIESVLPDKLVAIDFGLSSISDKVEDKAVDLYVLERALLSTHPDYMDSLFYNALLEGYRGVNTSQSIEVLSKLNEVRLRGRKREMIG